VKRGILNQNGVSGCLWGLPAGLGYTAWYAAQRVKWQINAQWVFNLRCAAAYPFGFA